MMSNGNEHSSPPNSEVAAQLPVGGAPTLQRLGRVLRFHRLLLVALFFAAHGSRIHAPFEGDDYHVLRALNAPGTKLGWLAAYDYDAPNFYMPWWNAYTYQRRFVRVLPCVALKIEAAVFSYVPDLYRVVTSLLLAGTLFVIYDCLRRCVSRRVAWVALMPTACHPALGEIVQEMNCQPIAVAGFMSALAVALWMRPSRLSQWGALVCGLLAMTSYEAAVLLPLLLLATDLARRGVASSPGEARAWDWRRTASCLALFVVYTPIGIFWRQGVTHPDTGPMRPADEIIRSGAIDLTAYGAKILCLFDAAAPVEYWLQNAIGQWASGALLVAVCVLAWRRGASSPLLWLGGASAALFLGPPLWVRAAVAYHNLPSFRQLALPMLLGIPPVVAAVLDRRRRTPWSLVAIGGWTVFGVVQSNRSFLVSSRKRLTAHMTQVVDRLLAGEDREKTLVVVGHSRVCGYSPAAAWHEGPILWPFPSDRNGAEPTVTVLDEHTVEASSASGFSIPLDGPELPAREEPYTRGGWRQVRLPPFDEDQTYREPGMSVRWVQRNANYPTVLRATFERSLRDSVVLVIERCKKARVQPTSVPPQ